MTPKESSATSKLVNILQQYRGLQYGYIRDGKVKQPDNQYFVDRYRLQSPDQLKKSLAGVCWDTSKAIAQDMRDEGLPVQELYMELSDPDGRIPTHTVPIVDEGDRGSYVIEKAWIPYKGILHTKNLKTIIDIYKKRMQKQYGKYPVRFWLMDKPVKAGATVDEYMAAAKQKEIK